MKNAGRGGSRFKTYQEAAEEIIQGCIDIADEVGNTKIGRPHFGASEEDRNYIESPYSLNSIEDFVDNIISIRNSYCGASGATASISDYVKKHDAALDTRMRKAIDDAIAAIKAINAARMALGGTGAHFVPLDKVIRTMLDTGRDMQSKYKETAQGGLAVNVVNC